MTMEQTVPNGENGVRLPKQKQFGKRPVRPDFTARDEKVKTLQAKVKEYVELSKAKTAELEALQNESKGHSKMEALKRSLANIVHSRVQVQKLQELTRKRLDDFRNAKKVGAPSKKGIDLKSSPEDLLKMMEQLKDKVATEQDPEESTRLIARIQALNASYVQIAAAEQGSAPAGDAVRATLEEDLKKYADELKVIAGKEKELRHQLTELRDQLDLSQPHIDRLKKERETCQDVVRSLRDKITAINEEYQGKFDEFKAQMDAWAAEREEVLKEREALKAQETKDRAEEKVRREREAKGPPFCSQIVACDQLLAWCKQYQKTEAKAAAVAKEPHDVVEFEGMFVKSKKTPEGDDDVFATSRSKSKKTARRSGRGSATGAEAKVTPQKIQHDMDTLALLSTLKLSVPTSTAEIEEVATTVSALKREYEDKQKRALAGEEVPEEEVDAPALQKKETKGSATKRGAVGVSIRCDEAFGVVLLELAAQ